MRTLWVTVLAGVLTACAAKPVPLGQTCKTGDVQLHAEFSQARAAECERTGLTSFSVTISPEATPINPSPWYAFEIVSTHDAEVSVSMNYAHSVHRYRPKRQTVDGLDVLPESAVTLEDDGRRAVIQLDVQKGRTIVAAQEWLPVDERLSWVQRFSERSGLTHTEIGQTVEGRPVVALSGGADEPGTPLIIILGGQHPPEIPGVFGMRGFLEALLLAPSSSDTFLATHGVLIVPEMNLDGLERGHWRLNTGLVDLNRDWGPFSQPETRAVRDEIDRLTSKGYRPTLMLDFHATRRNVFYTSPDGVGLRPGDFARRWMAAIEAQWFGEMPRRSSSHNPGLPTSRTWFVETYAAPAMTVEFGDETPRDDIDALAAIYAGTLVDLLDAELTLEISP